MWSGPRRVAIIERVVAYQGWPQPVGFLVLNSSNNDMKVIRPKKVKLNVNFI